LIWPVMVLAMAIAIVWWIPIPRELQQSPAGTLTLLDCRGREIAELASAEARTQFPIPLERVGLWLPRVTVALEDRRFYEHSGIDWHALAAAAARNLRSRHLVSGASTITQQLVKLATGRERRSWSRKLYEAIIAWKLEHRWSKERILAEYLNRSSYGNRRIGPEAAARAYFDKSARERSDFSGRPAPGADALKSVATSRRGRTQIRSVACAAGSARFYRPRSGTASCPAAENRARGFAATCTAFC